jgi:hypothetical protein
VRPVQRNSRWSRVVLNIMCYWRNWFGRSSMAELCTALTVVLLVVLIVAILPLLVLDALEAGMRKRYIKFDGKPRRRYTLAELLPTYFHRDASKGMLRSVP